MVEHKSEFTTSCWRRRRFRWRNHLRRCCFRTRSAPTELTPKADSLITWRTACERGGLFHFLCRAAVPHPGL